MKFSSAALILMTAVSSANVSPSSGERTFASSPSKAQIPSSNGHVLMHRNAHKQANARPGATAAFMNDEETQRLISPSSSDKDGALDLDVDVDTINISIRGGDAALGSYKQAWEDSTPTRWLDEVKQEEEED